MTETNQVPLVELLAAVPADILIGVDDGNGWKAGTTWHPVGLLCHEAAAELRRLEGEIERKSDAIQRLWKKRDDLGAVNAQLLKALKVARREAICWYAQSWGFDPEVDELPDWLIEIDAAIKAAKEQA